LGVSELSGLSLEDRGLALSLAIACIFLLGAGTLDDVQPIGFKVKFLLQFALSGILVLLLGNHFEAISLLGHRIELGGFGLFASLFWFVALMNAFNIIDGIDGLAGGAALCGLVSIAMLALNDGAGALLLCALALAGVVGGFLPFNFHRRTKAFLGDTGSQFLGVSLALLTLKAQQLPSVGCSALVPLLLVGYPLFDVALAMVRRFLRCGRRRFSTRFTRMFMADNDHLHHRLVYLGMNHLQSAGLLLLLSASFAAASFILANTDWRGTLLVFGYLTVAVAALLDRLGYLGSRPMLSLARPKAPERVVGVITGSELFLHSLRNFRQSDFQFLHLPTNLTSFIGPDLAAVVLYNGLPERFDGQWTSLLRMQEFQEVPAIVVAGQVEIAKVRQQNPGGFRHIRLLEKPGRIPEIIRELESLQLPAKAAKRVPRPERRFSLAELALRNGDR
jgi:UDP-GlcNAc:undecaprenyl-phosphate GlcNAc-1-phosphate transferase